VAVVQVLVATEAMQVVKVVDTEQMGFHQQSRDLL
jgi:hypothetical protein